MMTRHPWFPTHALALMLIAGALLATACSRQDKGLDQKLLELARQDETIDASDWQVIDTYLRDNRIRHEDWFDGETLDAEAVKLYIDDFFATRRPAQTITYVGIGRHGAQGPMKVKFYLERSGSMTPYDAQRTGGEFKSAVVSLLNSLPGQDEDNIIYVVNDAVYNYPDGYRDFVRQGNIFAATTRLGDPSYTDFTCILDSVLNQNHENELSILVTDLIYSTASMTQMSTDKIFSEEANITNTVFRNRVRDKALLVLRMEGSYDGNYYSYDNPRQGKPYRGKRPYYFLITGDNDVLRRIADDPAYREFADFTRLRGFRDMYVFETSDVYSPYYTLIVGDENQRGRFRPQRGGSRNQITAIEDLEEDRNSGEIRLALGINLGQMLIDPQYMTDPANYLVESEDPITIEKIEPIEPSDITPRNKPYLENATHRMVLRIPKFTHKQEVSIRLLNRLPDWVQQAHSNDDRDLTAADFPTTTFGLQPLMEGIYRSYRKESDGTPRYFTLTLTLDK